MDRRQPRIGLRFMRLKLPEWLKNDVVVLIAVATLLVFSISFSVHLVTEKIDKAGGIKSIAVSIGKDIKAIAEEINEED